MLEPRLRVLAALLGSVLLAMMQNVSGLISALLFAGVLSLALVWADRLPPAIRRMPALDPGMGVRRLLAVNTLTLLVWLTLPWDFRSAVGVEWSESGAQQALIITLRLNAISLWCLVWLANMEPTSLASALRSLGVSARLALLAYLSVRSFENLMLIHRRLQCAMRARAAPVRFTRRLQNTAQLLVSLLVEGLRRAEIFAVALRARGLDLQSGGLLLSRAPWRTVPRRDCLLVALCLLALALPAWVIS